MSNALRLYDAQTVDVHRRGIDLEAWLPYFLDDTDVLASTKSTYARVIRLFNRYLSENHITHPQKADAIAYKDKLLAEGKSASTIQNYLIGIKQIFKWAVDKDLYPVDITKGVRNVKITREHKRDALTMEQVKKVAQTFDRNTPKGKRNYAIYALMVTTGARSIEVVRADIGDIGTFYGELALYVQGKGMLDKSRALKIAPQTEDAITDYLSSRGKVDDAAPLFASMSNSNKGKRLTTRSIRGIMKDAFNQSIHTTNRVSSHSLRHTFATENLKAGGSLQETQHVLGHSSITTTMNYTHNHSRQNNHSEARVANLLLD